MSNQTFKVTMNKLYVESDGDFPGQGDIYYSLLVDSETIAELDKDDALKTGDGETIIIGRVGTVTKSDNATLTVLGSVSDSDGFLKGDDDTGSFKHVYTKANAFGVGSHTALVRNGRGNLKVTVYYSIARA